MADTSATPTKEPPAWQQENMARTKELTDKLEAGIQELRSSDKYKDYLKSMSHFHNYSSRNIMLIHQQLPGATRVASYKLWNDVFNRQVKKGETSLRIFAPIERKPETQMMEKLDPQTGTPMKDENGKVIMEEMTALNAKGVGFKLVPVFDVSQTYGEPLPQLAEDLTGNVEHYEAFLDTLREVSPLPIEFEPMNDNQDGYCQHGVKIGVREGMSEIQTVSAIIHEITHARLHDRDSLAETDKPKSKEVREIEAESVSYVVCQKYGIETGDNSFGYLASWSSQDMSEFKASLDTIRKEANGLITAIDGRFMSICKERGIDLIATEQAEPVQQAPTAETPTEPTFTTESTTENIAGVDFTVSEVVPTSEEKVTEYHIGSGPTENGVEVWNWNETEDKDGQPKYLATINFDREITYFDDTLPEDVKTEIVDISKADWKEVYAIEMAGMDYDPPPPPWERTETISEPMPDPSISTADRDAYGYAYEGLLPLNTDRAVELFEQDNTIYLLYPDDTEGMAFDVDEIKNHDGIFGIEREDWVNSKEYAELSAQVAQPEQTTSAIEQGEPADNDPPPPEIPKNEQPVYKQKPDPNIDLAGDELTAYYTSLNLNVECGNAIDKAIIASNYEEHRYDLKTAARDVIEEFGADRVSWVLASNINNNPDGRLSNATKTWAKEFDTPETYVYLKTHKAVLDGFVDNFRKVEKEKPSLMTALKAGEQKSKAEFDGKAQPGHDAPNKTTKNNSER